MIDFACLLLDLDGVIRHFESHVIAEIERSHGLEPGTILRVAFRSDLLQPAITGAMDRTEWTRLVGEEIGSMAEAWRHQEVAIDWEVLDIVARVRSTGRRVAILTNGVSSTRSELEVLGITPSFDRIFVTYEMGVSKPDSAAYLQVSSTFGIAPGDILFFDDSQTKVDGAIRAGFQAHLFTDVDGLAEVIFKPQNQ